MNTITKSFDHIFPNSTFFLREAPDPSYEFATDPITGKFSRSDERASNKDGQLLSKYVVSVISPDGMFEIQVTAPDSSDDLKPSASIHFLDLVENRKSASSQSRNDRGMFNTLSYTAKGVAASKESLNKLTAQAGSKLGEDKSPK